MPDLQGIGDLIGIYMIINIIIVVIFIISFFIFLGIWFKLGDIRDSLKELIESKKNTWQN